jgi:hypothetical protein
MIYWLLTREVLSLKGQLEGDQFNELPDLFMYRNVEKKEEKTEEEVREGEVQADYGEENKEGGEEEEHFLDEEA